MKKNLKIPEYQRPYRWSTESTLTLVTEWVKIFIQIIASSIVRMIRNLTAEYNKGASDKNAKFRLYI